MRQQKLDCRKRRSRSSLYGGGQPPPNPPRSHARRKCGLPQGKVLAAPKRTSGAFTHASRYAMHAQRCNPQVCADSQWLHEALCAVATLNAGTAGSQRPDVDARHARRPPRSLVGLRSRRESRQRKSGLGGCTRGERVPATEREEARVGASRAQWCLRPREGRREP